jgi:hypothetical protein
MHESKREHSDKSAVNRVRRKHFGEVCLFNYAVSRVIGRTARNAAEGFASFKVLYAYRMDNLNELDPSLNPAIMQYHQEHHDGDADNPEAPFSRAQTSKCDGKDQQISRAYEQ